MKRAWRVIGAALFIAGMICVAIAGNFVVAAILRSIDPTPGNMAVVAVIFVSVYGAMWFTKGGKRSFFGGDE